MDDTAGLLELVLPDVVWEYRFAPTEADPESIHQQRQLVREHYESAIEVYQEAKNYLIQKSQLNADCEDSESLEELRDGLEQHHYPALVTPVNTMIPFVDI